MSNKLICRICLKIVEGDGHTYLNTNFINGIDNCKSLGELLEECVSEVNLQLTDSPLICNECLVRLKISIHFKEVCHKTEEQVYNYMKFNDCLEKCLNIDLKEVIELKDKHNDLEKITSLKVNFEQHPDVIEDKLDNIKNLEQICRTCLKTTLGYNFISADDGIDINETQISVKVLEECVSLICLQSTNPLLICNECNEMLKNTYILKKMCCDTEEELYNYMKLHDLHLDKTSNIQLVDVLNSKDQLHLFKDNNSEFIKQSEFRCEKKPATVNSSTSDQSIPNLPRTKREALKKANSRILYLIKQDLESDCQSHDESSKPHRKKTKSLSRKSNMKTSKLQPLKSNLRKSKSHLPKSVQTKSKSNLKKLKSQRIKSDPNESKSLSQSRNYKCKKCQYKAYRMDLLIRHKLKCKNRYKNEEELYNKKCKYCSKKFIRNSHLKRHEYIHTQISDYVCENCGQVFAEKYQLKTHEARHTLAEGAFKCHHCNKKFFRNCDLQAHIRRTVLKKEKFMCKYCNKEFGDKRDRLSHMSKYHTGDELPFKCSRCSFSTVYSKRFLSHKKKCN